MGRKQKKVSFIYVSSRFFLKKKKIDEGTKNKEQASAMPSVGEKNIFIME
jgi:hypothetical protein